jgi:hypothetical protein
MVDNQTWSRLNETAREEFQRLLPIFQESLRRSGVHDGQDLAADWTVELAGGSWVISNGTTTLAGVSSKRREVIDALYTDGVQNLNR